MSAPEPATPASTASVPDRRCPNCASVVTGRFCAECGQEWRTLRIPFHALAGEALGEIFSADSRIGRTLARLIFRPGLATRAWLDGRRASQTSPVKVYLLASFLFFLASALGPSGPGAVQVGDEAASAGGAAVAAGPEKIDFPDDWLASLRAKGGARAWLAARLEALEREPPAALQRRISESFDENVPTAMFFLVPVLALLLRLAYPRTPVFFAEHLVFALHAHAVAFLFLLPSAALGSDGAQNAGFLAAAGHFGLALRRVYGQGWLATFAKAALVGFAYLLALGFTLVAVVLVAVLA